MKRRILYITVVIGVFMSLFSCLSNKSKEQVFWNWFIKNSERLFNFESNQEQIFNELSLELGKINKDLTFEFGPIENNKRDFVISAAGIKAAFPYVEILYNDKPVLEKWNIIKFRPRRDKLYTISMNNISIKPEDIKYVLFKDENPNKVGILLFINGYKKEKHNDYGQIGYLFLDGIIGEYDVETYVGAIEIQGFDSEYYNKSINIEELANDFDNSINK